MSVRIIILLFLALSTAGGTAILAKNWLVNERAELMASVPKIIEKNNDTKEILVAKTDIVPGSFVLKEKLEWQEWPEDALSDLMLKKGDVEMEDFVGSVVRSRIPAGQPLVPSAIVKSGEQGFMAAVLAPGMRAVTVKIDATSGVGGFVFPGDAIDLLLTVSFKQGKQKRSFTETLLKDIRVIGKDQSAEQVEGEVNVAKSATLEVTPKQAEAVALAAQMGSLSLSLRSLADEEIVISEALHAPQEIIEGLKHRISFQQGPVKSDEIPRLEIQDEMSLTTDRDVNFYYKKLRKVPSTGGQSSRKVQVLRGSETTEKKF